MDTTTVNYTIERLEKAIGTIAPQLGNFTEEYVSFAIFEWRVLTLLFFVLSIISLASLPFFIKKIKEKRNTDAEMFYVLFALLLGAFGSILFTCLIISLYNLMMITYNPHVYLIQKLISK